MKKIISLLLSVIMVFSLLSVTAVAAEPELVITVANDLHLNLSTTGVNAPIGQFAKTDFSHVPHSGQLYVESEAIIDAFLEAAAGNESSAVLLPGDVTDKGTVKELEAIAAKLTAFEKETGKSVYVVPGNHDLRVNITVEMFRDIFKELGYGEAISQDSLSASYVVDLEGGYRLLAIDSCAPGVGGGAIDAERVQWIREEAKKAQEDGKKVISMMHHNFINHFMFNDLLNEYANLDPELGIAEIFAEYNVKYNFVGHTHAHDIKAYKGENGNEIYSILTSTLNAYPSPYRVVSFGDKVEIKTERVRAIDTSSFKGIITDNCHAMCTEDFQDYAKKATYYGMEKVVDEYFTTAKLRSLLKLDEEKTPEMWELLGELGPVIREAIYLPLYETGETEDGKSIEAMGKKLSLTLPASGYETVADIVIFAYRQYVMGDENYGLLSTEYNLISVIIPVVLNYILSEVTAEDYATVLNFLCGYLKLNLPANFLSYTGSAISRIEGIELFASAVMNGIVLVFTTDDAPGDHNVTLGGYDKAVEETELSFWDRIVSFFTSFFDWILRFFGVGR